MVILYRIWRDRAISSRTVRYIREAMDLLIHIPAGIWHWAEQMVCWTDICKESARTGLI